MRDTTVRITIFSLCESAGHSTRKEQKRNSEERRGLITGVFFVVLFLCRFLIEFVKNPQESFEVGMLLNMGQLLSLPFIIAGVVLVVRALLRPRVAIDYKNEFAPEEKKK